jgi:hypothetical protein
MDYNLHNYSTERLRELLAEKLKKPQTPVIAQIIEAIQAELAARAR